MCLTSGHRQNNSSHRGPLFGVPMIIKDQIETAGIATAYGSKIAKTHVPKEDATLVRKLKEAGAVILGKSNMPDWAASWFSTSSLSGETKNPYDLSRDPGGSSSGSGAAVAANLCVAAIGGDTGGSIRLPSSFCGLVGVRVTPGRISRHGMSSLVETQDTPGPMARSVEDAARILDVIVGYDEKDEYTSINAIATSASQASSPSTQFQDCIKNPSMRGKRIGVLRSAFGSDQGILKLLDRAEESIKTSGATMMDVDIPDIDRLKNFTSVYVSRSRYDINRFLASRGFSETLQSIYAAGDYHKALDLIGDIAEGPKHPKDDPTFAEKLMEQARYQRLVAAIFAKNQLDAIIYPTCQVLAPKTEELLDGTWTCLGYPTNTIIASQLLFPAASVPIGLTKDLKDGVDGPYLPVGLEILGLPLSEERVLNVAAAVETIGLTKSRI